MSKSYQPVEMEIIAFAVEDVIVTSENCETELPDQHL